MFLTFLLIGARMRDLEFNFKMEYIETVSISGSAHVRMLPWGIPDEEVSSLRHVNENHEGGYVS